MKQILVFTITKINPPFDNGIYTSLYKKIAKRNKVDIISFGLKEETHQISDNIRLFILKNGDYFKVNNIKKAINQLMLSRKIIKKIKKDLKLCDYDLLLYSTPPITMNKAISY